MTPQELKSSILQFAVQGKLVEQCPEEGTGEELFQQIQAEKAKLIKEGKIKKEKPLPKITEEEITFDIPESWKWVRIGNLSSLVTKGTTPRGGNVSYCDSGVGFLRAENVAGIDRLDTSNLKHIDTDTHNGFLKRSIIKANDVLVTIAGTLGRTAVVREKDLPLNANQAVAIIRLVEATLVDLLFLVYALNAATVNRYLTKQRKVTAIPNLTLEIIENCLIPLPPLAEQKRIVAKIEELLPLIDRYEQVWTKLEAFNKRFPDDMQKSVLQMAIQGKLVEQRPEEGTGEELYKQIQAEKARLIREGKIKKEKPIADISEDEIPFDIPESWKWVRLKDIVTNHGQMVPCSVFSYIDIGSIDNQKQLLNNEENIIPPEKAPSRARKIVKKGDILYATVRPYLHNMCIVDREFSYTPIASTGFAVLTCINPLYNKYLFYFLLSPAFDNYANDSQNAKGVAYPAINDKQLYKAVIPIPPLSEQKRIVQKLNEILPLFDKLK